MPWRVGWEACRGWVPGSGGPHRSYGATLPRKQGRAGSPGRQWGYSYRGPVLSSHCPALGLALRPGHCKPFCFPHSFPKGPLAIAFPGPPIPQPNLSSDSSSLLTQALTMRPHLGGKGILTEILKRCCSNGRSTDIILVGQRALQRSLKGACAGGPVGKTLHSQRPGPSLILGWGTVSYLPQ